MFNQIGPIYTKYHLTINLKSLLFVPTIIYDYQPHFKLRWEHRKLIYNALTNFVLDSKRIQWFKI